MLLSPEPVNLWAASSPGRMPLPSPLPPSWCWCSDGSPFKESGRYRWGQAWGASGVSLDFCHLWAPNLVGQSPGNLADHRFGGEDRLFPWGSETEGCTGKVQGSRRGSSLILHCTGRLSMCLGNDGPVFLLEATENAFVRALPSVFSS